MKLLVLHVLLDMILLQMFVSQYVGIILELNMNSVMMEIHNHMTDALHNVKLKITSIVLQLFSNNQNVFFQVNLKFM
jgi:hypothetical protein